MNGFFGPPNSHPNNFFYNPTGFMNNMVNQGTNFFQNFMAPPDPSRSRGRQRSVDEPSPLFTNTRSTFYENKTNQQEKARQMKKSEIQKSEQSSSMLSENMGEFWKQKGNDCFNKKDYSEAIQMYTEAIKKNQSISIYYSNRAQCHQYLNHTEEAYKDALQSIELDEKNVFGNLIAGQLLAEKGQFEQDTQKIENSISQISQALRLCSGQGKTKHQKDISIFLFRAKKLLFLKQLEIQLTRANEWLENYKKILKQIGQSDKEIEQESIMYKQSFPECFQLPDMTIPQHLICNITFDLIEDPVITSAGFTYERAVIEEHMKKNGLTDPMNRQPISEKLTPNLAVKQGIDQFLKNNPWAYQYTSEPNYFQIQF